MYNYQKITTKYNVTILVIFIQKISVLFKYCKSWKPLNWQSVQSCIKTWQEYHIKKNYRPVSFVSKETCSIHSILEYIIYTRTYIILVYCILIILY